MPSVSMGAAAERPVRPLTSATPSLAICMGHHGISVLLHRRYIQKVQRPQMLHYSTVVAEELPVSEMFSAYCTLKQACATMPVLAASVLSWGRGWITGAYEACEGSHLCGEVCCGVCRGRQEDAVSGGGIALLHLRQRPQHLQDAVHVAAVPQVLQSHIPVYTPFAQPK